MRLLEWFLQFFRPVKAAPRRVKFLEGTQWLCPRCRTVLGTATRDIFAGDRVKSGWDSLIARSHCNVPVARERGNGTHEIFTPTGWVG